MTFTDHTVSLFTLGDSEATVASLTVEVGGEVFGAERSSRRARGDRYRRGVGQALATARVLRTVAEQIEAHAQQVMPFEAEVPPKPTTLNWVRDFPGGVHLYSYSDGSYRWEDPPGVKDWAQQVVASAQALADLGIHWPAGAPHQFASGEAESTGGEQHGHS